LNSINWKCPVFDEISTGTKVINQIWNFITFKLDSTAWKIELHYTFCLYLVILIHTISYHRKQAQWSWKQLKTWWYSWSFSTPSIYRKKIKKPYYFRDLNPQTLGFKPGTKPLRSAVLVLLCNSNQIWRAKNAFKLKNNAFLLFER
jgi:hypothetical protein